MEEHESELIPRQTLFGNPERTADRSMSVPRPPPEDALAAHPVPAP